MSWPAEAVRAFVAVVGEDHVSTAPGELAAAGAATFATRHRVSAVVRPADRVQVQQCVRAARRLGVALYPVSRGRNWGLGSRVPSADGCALLDLSRMNRIVELDERLAFVTVEPGVTFRQVHALLAERGGSLCLSVIGGPPGASVIGNVVERGDGIGPYGDRLAHACGFEVVLGTGECVRSGFARFAGARAAAVHRGGVGPQIDGLFTQSRHGIVTRLTIWLMPRPDHFQVFTCGVGGGRALPAFVEAVRPLALRRAFDDNGLALWNGHKLRARGAADDSPRAGAGDWFACGTIGSMDSAEGGARRAVIERRLGPHARGLRFFGDGGEAAIPEPNVFLGVPDDHNVRSVYARKPGGAPADVDPDRDRCGLIWLCEAVPLLGEVIGDTVAAVEEAVSAAGFEPNLALQCVTGRCAHLLLAIAYDRDVAGEDARAMACHDRVFDLLARGGILPYRLGVHSMSRLPASSDDSDPLLGRLEIAFDPDGVLAPRRYAPSPR